MGALGLIIPLAWRNLWRNPRRTGITLLVVSAGMWSILVFAILLHAWADSSRGTTVRLLTGEGQIHAQGYLDDPTIGHSMPLPGGALLRALTSRDVSAYAARVRVLAIAQSEYRTLPMTLVGVTPAAERRVSSIPDQIAAGRYLQSPSDAGVVIGAPSGAATENRSRQTHRRHGASARRSSG